MILPDTSGGRKIVINRVKQSPAEWAARVREDVQDMQDDIPVELKKVSIRLGEDSISLLDYVSNKLRMSRSALIEELVVRALDEAAVAVGVPTDEEGFFIVEDDEPSVGQISKAAMKAANRVSSAASADRARHMQNARDLGAF